MLGQLLVVFALVGQCNGNYCVDDSGWNYVADNQPPTVTVEYKSCEGVTSKEYVTCQFASDYKVKTPVLNGILPRPTIYRDHKNRVSHIILDYGKGFAFNECVLESDGSIKYRTKAEMAEYQAGMVAVTRQTIVTTKTANTPVFVPPTPTPPASIKTTDVKVIQSDNNELLKAIKELDSKIQMVDKKMQVIDQLQARMQALEERIPAKTLSAPAIVVPTPDLDLKRPSEVKGSDN